MDFGNLETQIASYLSGKINNTEIEVKPIPENEIGFEKNFGKETIIVAFSDEEPEASIKSTSTVLQDTSVTFAMLIQSTTLRGNGDRLGIYSIHELIKKHMIGYTPEGGTALSYAGFKMQDKAENVFQYAVYLKCKSFVMQETDNDNSDGALLNRITYIT